MNRAQHHDRLCLGEPGFTASIHRLCAIVLAGVAILAGVTGTSDASSTNTRRTGANASSINLSSGIRDPMNPEAYMRDLATRMKPTDQKMFLQGTNVPRVGPAPQVPTVQGGPVVRGGPVVQGVPIVRSNPAVQGVPVVQGVPIVQGPTPRVGSPSPTPGNAPVRELGVPAGATAGVATPPSVLSAPNPQATSAESVLPAPRPQAGPVQSILPAPSPQATSAESVLPAPSPQGVPIVRNPAAPSESVVSLSTGAGTGPEPQNLARENVVPESASGTWQPPVPAVGATPQAPRALDGPLTTLPAGAPLPAMLATPAGSGSDYLASSTGIGSPSLGAYPARARSPMPRGPGSVQKALLAGTSGLTLWEEPKPASQTAQAPEPKVPWTLGGDLEKYRAYAVKEGSRSSGESLKKALERAGMTLGDSANVFLLGYASERTKPFRANDGKGFFQEPGKVPQRAGATIGSLGYTVYSILDLATLNALPDPNKPAYEDNNPLVRPLLFTGRTIGGAWKTTEEVGNALTWGLFDNVTGCVGLVIEDILELLKHAGQAVTNVARVPFHLAAGKKPHEGTDRALDWVLLVPLELASNAVEMKGISNMVDYKTAFADKGVIGSVLEFGGSSYIVYRAVDKLADEFKNDKPKRAPSQNQNGQPGDGSTQPPEPPEPPAPPPVEDTWEINYPVDGQFADFDWWTEV